MKSHQRSISGSAQQESLMREVLAGLEETAIMLSYDPWPGDFEIIAIYPAEQEDAPRREKTVIRSLAARRSASGNNVISYEAYKRLRLKLTA